MKKKILSLILATAMVATVLTACGDKTSEESTSEVQTVVGSDAKDTSEAAEDKGGEVAENSETASTYDGRAVLEMKKKFLDGDNSEMDAFLESYGVVPNSNYGITFTSDAIRDYLNSGEYTYANSVYAVFWNDICDGSKHSIFFGENYNNTTDLINDLFTNTQIDECYTELADGTTNADMIANAIDSVAAQEGTSVYSIFEAQDESSVFMVYYENGNAYGIENITVAENGTIQFAWSVHAGNENHPVAYKIHFTDGVVDSIN